MGDIQVWKDTYLKDSCILHKVNNALRSELIRRNWFTDWRKYRWAIEVSLVGSEFDSALYQL